MKTKMMPQTMELTAAQKLVSRTLSKVITSRLRLALLAAVCFAFAAPVLALDGALDTTWHAEARMVSLVRRVFVDPGGRVYLSSDASFPADPDGSSSLIRLNADGSRDNSFNAAVGVTPDVGLVKTLAFQPDGRIVYGSRELHAVGRLNENGTLDFWHRLWSPAAAQVNAVVLQPDGKIVAAGVFDTEFIQPGGPDLSASPHHDIARFNADGTWEESFPVVGGISDTGNVPAQFNATALALQADGKILVGGCFSMIGDQPRNSIARLNSDGSLDSGFNTDWTALDANLDGALYITRIAELADHSILVAGTFSGSVLNGGLVRLHADGSLDLGFVPTSVPGYIRGSPGYSTDRVIDFAVQADGRILIIGRFNQVGGAPRPELARLNADGSLDPTFVPDDIANWYAHIEALALQDEGHLLIAGSFRRLGGVPVPYVARLLTAPSSLVITTQPQTGSAIAGAPTTLSVVASGTKPLNYQWRKNGSEIPGATGRTLSLPQAGFADAGDYNVVITNPSESIASAAATLTVLNAEHPQSYAMRNGITFRDESYSGAGNPTIDLSPLSGGLGQLSDGILPGYSFDGPDYGNYAPWVGWPGDVTVTFDFGSIHSFQHVAIQAQAYDPIGVDIFSGATILFSDDGVAFSPASSFTPDTTLFGDMAGGGTLYAGPGSPFTPTAEQSVNGARLIPIPVSGSGRFVRLQLAGQAWIMIGEVMFGSAHPANPPVPDLPALPAITGQCSVTLATAPTATAGDASPITGTTTDPLSYTAPGAYTVTWHYRDSNGTESTQTQMVWVQDTTAPVPDLPTLPTITGQCSATIATTPTATDNCAGPITGTTIDPLCYISPGAYTITWHYDDGHGNVSAQAQTVIVQDTIPPAITCPADIPVACGVDQFVPVTFSATATDNCDPAPAITYSPAPGSGFPIGATIVTCTATDASGNPSSGTFNVIRAALGFSGFLAPIDGADATGGSFASPVRTFKTGTTIPVKFTASCGNAAVLTGTHRLQVILHSNATTYGEPIDATPRGSATTGDQFRLADAQWAFNLDTKATGMGSGIWLLRATLSDGSQHSTWIQLK